MKYFQQHSRTVWVSFWIIFITTQLTAMCDVFYLLKVFQYKWPPYPLKLYTATACISALGTLIALLGIRIHPTLLLLTTLITLFICGFFLRQGWVTTTPEYLKQDWGPLAFYPKGLTRFIPVVLLFYLLCAVFVVFIAPTLKRVWFSAIGKH